MYVPPKRDIQVYRPCKWIVLTDFSSCLNASPTVFTMWPRDIKACQFGSAKWFWPSIFAQFACWGW
jgi:hypothetical protein